MDYTTINISPDTKKKLWSVKKFKETDEELINRLLVLLEKETVEEKEEIDGG